MKKETIFVVEDEASTQQLIKYVLDLNNFNTVIFNSGEELLKEIQKTVPDLFILDIMLPGIDGFDICRYIRQTPNLKSLPIIMITAKCDEYDKVLALELGADDFMTKPFSVREMIARVKALLRRVSNTSSAKIEYLRFNDIIVDISRHEVFKNNNLIGMTLKEFELLKILLNNKGIVLSREFLLNNVWGSESYKKSKTVDVHIRYLRQKIEDDDKYPKYIETVRGIGYRFNTRIS